MVKKTQQKSADLAPAEIRRIRESLGLTQVEAGELLGGGSKAFAKYENGAIKPTASVTNLLRLLEKQPESLAALAGPRSLPIDTDTRRPFEVNAEHVKALTPKKLTLLVSRLLSAEAAGSEIPADGLHVAAQITVGDGGEDARIEWNNGPARTDFLPSRLCQFQLKATSLSPAKAAKDVLTKTGHVQPMIKTVIEAGGNYIMLVSHPAVKQSMLAHETAIRTKLRAAHLAFRDSQVAVRDGSQIAGWVNAHPSVASWLLEQTQPGLTGPFRDWAHWAGRDEHESSPWVEDQRLEPFRADLRQQLRASQAVVRVLGPSGVGKSRLTLEALSPDSQEEKSGIGVSSLVLYAVEAEAGEIALKAAVQALVDARSRAIVVIDRCDLATHDDLAAMVRRRNSKIALVTLDHEYDPNLTSAAGTLIVERAPRSVIEGMVRNTRHSRDDSDNQRIASLAAGFPQAARLIAASWDSSMETASNETLIDRVVVGRRGDHDKVLKASRLLSAFGFVGFQAPLDSEISDLAALPGAPAMHELREAFADLLHRNVAQLRGRLLSLQPLPLAQSLAARQWQQWGEAAWDEVLAGALNGKLRLRAARQLARYNQERFPTKITEAVCRRHGPFDSIEQLGEEGAAAVVECLAEVDAKSVVDLLTRVLAPLSRSQLLAIDGEARRSFVRALEKAAFLENCFEQAARLMLAFAAAENERWSNNATGNFKELFALAGGATQANADLRLQVLHDAVDEGDEHSLPVVVGALLECVNLQGGGIRLVGAEHHGSRPALKPWLPQTWDEVAAYVRACLERLGRIAVRKDAMGAQAKAGLGHQLRGLVGSGLLAEVEGTCLEVMARGGSWWPEALSSLGDFMIYDAEECLERDDISRLQRLIDRLKPDDLGSRVRFLVTEMPWDHPVDEKLDFGERDRRQIADVEALAAELLTTPDKLESLLSGVSRGSQRMAYAFGRALARGVDKPLVLLQSIMAAYEAIPQEERNFSLLGGFLGDLSHRDGKAVNDFKQMASASQTFAPTLPFVCSSIGLQPPDISLAINAAEVGLLPVHQLRLWSGGRALQPLSPDIVAPLFDKLLSATTAYPVALELMGMFVFGASEKLELLRPQLRLMAVRAAGQPKSMHSGMDKHHFDDMMKWVLAKGREDKDAAWIAATFARQVVASEDYRDCEMIKSLIPTLLRDFPEISWPIIGHAIVTEKKHAWLFELVLGDRFSFHTKRPAILDLPEEVLFAWCHAHPDQAPAFAARLLPILTTIQRDAQDRALHPIMARLLEEFGDREDVLRSVTMNMHSFGWSGSTADYYALYDQPLEPFERHKHGLLRRWAKKTREDLQKACQSVRTEEVEQDVHWNG